MNAMLLPMTDRVTGLMSGPMARTRLCPSVPLLAVAGLLGGLITAPALAQHRIVTLSPSLTEAVCALGHCAELVGTDTQRIVERVQRLLSDPAAYADMARGASPYGDGKAAARIVEILETSFAASDKTA